MAARPSIPLWSGAAPGTLGTAPEDIPQITPYVPDRVDARGAAVVVCPGGGYRNLSMEKEGSKVAEFLNGLGVTAFVLRYRLGPRYRHPVPLGDARRALRVVRSRASEFGVQRERLGLMGFSAGGHLTATVATHVDRGDAAATDPIDRESARPDFAILAYPVITLAENWLHRGSRTMLLAPDQQHPDILNDLSNERQVTADTPPTFLFHTDADTGVPAENSVAFYLALRKAKVPAELHIYEPGPHGVGLGGTDPALVTWPDRLAGWLRTRGLLTAAPA
ncbi:MAG: alpha/beta hydrolase [Vicinamibacteraceae bacterium]